MCTSGSTINTSWTNHSIFSDDFPAARPTNKETRCITRGTTTRGPESDRRGGGGLLPAGNDETDGLLSGARSSLRPKEKGSVPQERRARLSHSRGSLMKCRHYRYRTKPTSAPTVSAYTARVTLLPANTHAS